MPFAGSGEDKQEMSKEQAELIQSETWHEFKRIEFPEFPLLERIQWWRSWASWLMSPRIGSVKLWESYES